MPSEPSPYGIEGQALTKRRQVDSEHSIVFRADGIRQERTGTHARISVTCNGASLAWSNFNVEKDEDRVRLCNSAYQHLNGLSASYPKIHLKNDLDQFCGGLWDAQLARMRPEMMDGAEFRFGPSFLLKPYILMGGGTILFAPPGRGKSYTLLLMAVSMDAGLSTFWPVTKSKVLFVNLERSKDSVRQRLANVNDVLGLKRERPIPTINARGRSLMDVAPACERYIEEEGIQCIFIDSISRAGAGDLNANDATNKIIDQLNRFDIAWFGLGHTPRADESHLYGSVHFEAGADLVVQLTSEQEEEGPLGIGLQLTKKNDVGFAPMWRGAFEFDELGLINVRKARDGEFSGIEAGRRMTDKERIREHLADMGARSATQLADELGMRRDRAARVLSTDPAFIKAGTLGHQQLYGVAAEPLTVYPPAQLATVHPSEKSAQLGGSELPF